ncbi:protein tyrosine phosphatase [Novosphingobium sp. AAP83]|uniref:tyrosine-protein phosphatase n=1 Tax=Novosphingobium sp. AAP83 TaxID=1523425 RepID=UPI0006B8F555|nr:tyrosine-protein phosphatase [Novosphingobium sp. AAP83]KPF93550.1 protein tyrosine phosphatase [Novosphingobium sp. AAP83]
MSSARDQASPQDRLLPMKGIHNFRDFGGYGARGGKLRRGMLWRSGQHCDASPDDLALVHRVGIRTVIDLRGDSERASYPCLRHDAFGGEVLFHPGETSGGHGKAVHEHAAFNVRTAQEAHGAMLRIYTTLPFQPVLVGTYRLYMQALAERDSPSLLHCLAGKDRTGVGAALVHKLLGVHHDDIADDYLLTNTAGDPEARIAAGAQHVRAGFGPTMEDAALRVLMGVDAAFLDRSFGTMTERHGSVEAYARDVLGVTPQMVEAMEQRLVEA